MPLDVWSSKFFVLIISWLANKGVANITFEANLLVIFGIFKEILPKIKFRAKLLYEFKYTYETTFSYKLRWPRGLRHRDRTIKVQGSNPMEGKFFLSFWSFSFLFLALKGLRTSEKGQKWLKIEDKIFKLRRRKRKKFPPIRARTLDVRITGMVP